MEARASLNGSSVSKTFVAAILVLVAMGLGAMGGYVAKGLGATGTTGAQTQVAYPAPGTVLRQDNPARQVVRPAPGSVIRQDNPAGQSANGSDTQPIQAIRGGHRELP
jgi:hypothetical protein